ncbi:hypothetical protein [Brochothrix campestris]|uniref:Uncharacterized protein n=1 Tax=Brochothrix campestris FSL F6-1037 TaxID=1265861 RepID=W7CYC8_9LIST|nr:hypothetical protein [Brochothrix campestris]EUJ38023.1 hypothetical protein BCAMP_09200 [Brochothrix campestris FSL F6-1037]
MITKTLPYLLTFGAAIFALFVLQLSARDTFIFMLMSLLIVSSSAFLANKKTAPLGVLFTKSLLFSIIATIYFSCLTDYSAFTILLIGVVIFVISFIQVGINRDLSSDQTK